MHTVFFMQEGRMQSYWVDDIKFCIFLDNNGGLSESNIKWDIF